MEGEERKACVEPASPQASAPSVQATAKSSRKLILMRMVVCASELDVTN